MYQTFVKPTKNPILSEFCTELTSIQQNEVDCAPYFSEAVYDFDNWITNDNTNTTLISWGYYDKKQLLQECEVKNYNEIYDPFYSEKNQARLTKSIADAEAGKVTVHELIELD